MVFGAGSLVTPHPSCNSSPSCRWWVLPATFPLNCVRASPTTRRVTSGPWAVSSMSCQPQEGLEAAVSKSPEGEQLGKSPPSSPEVRGPKHHYVSLSRLVDYPRLGLYLPSHCGFLRGGTAQACAMSPGLGREAPAVQGPHRSQPSWLMRDTAQGPKIITLLRANYSRNSEMIPTTCRKRL